MSKLFIVATPIGNLEDFTFRALRILQEADLVLAEDTRVTQKLLQHYKIKKDLIAWHQHSKNFSKIKKTITPSNSSKDISKVKLPAFSTASGSRCKNAPPNRVPALKLTINIKKCLDCFFPITEKIPISEISDTTSTLAMI